MDSTALPDPLDRSRSGWPWTVEPGNHQPPPVEGQQLPKLTVITPSFNQGQFLEETIRSVLAQGYPALEYIVLDGGSTDNTTDILSHYDHVITHWQSGPDKGQADAINRGFAMASGSVLAWLNSDDVYLPGTLLTVGQQFALRPASQLIYGEGWYIDEDSNRLEPCRFVRRNFSRTYIINRDPILQPAAFWRQELWQAAGPLNTNLNWVFDWEWFIRAYGLAEFTYLPQFLASYRIQPAAKTRTGGLARQQEHGSVTRQYGGIWHPNHVVQRTRAVEARAEQALARWPRPLAWPLQGLASLPRIVAERLLYGTYMR